MNRQLVILLFITLFYQNAFAISHTCRISKMINVATPEEILDIRTISLAPSKDNNPSFFFLNPETGIYLECRYNKTNTLSEMICEITAEGKMILRNVLPSSVSSIKQFALIRPQLGYAIDCEKNSED